MNRKEKKIKSEKRIALITVIIMIINMFSPFILLFNTVIAATGVIEEKPVLINNLGITNKGSNKVLTIELAIYN